MLNPFHVNSQKVLYVSLIIPVMLRSFKASDANEHSDSTISSEQINIPNIVFLKDTCDKHVPVSMNGNQVIQVILEKKF